VMAALGGERIDIIDWTEDISTFIKESLSPASVLEVELNEADHRAVVKVSEDQQSLAIGRGGQNVRLAAKLTGWNIDILSIGGQNVAESDGEAVSIQGVESESVVDESAKESEAATEERIDEGAVEMAQAMADPEVEDDQPEVDGIDGITEQNAIITEEDPASNILVAEEELTLEENESVADEKESR
jgi:N utilization substance protein A